MRTKSLAVVFAVIVGVLLAGSELLMTEVLTPGRGRTPLAVICDFTETLTSMRINGWACLIGPIVLAFLFGLAMDAINRTGRAR